MGAVLFQLTAPISYHAFDEIEDPDMKRSIICLIIVAAALSFAACMGWDSGSSGGFDDAVPGDVIFSRTFDPEPAPTSTPTHVPAQTTASPEPTETAR